MRPETSVTKRSSERDVREATCDKRNTVVKEGDTINVLCDTVFIQVSSTTSGLD